MAFPKRLRVCIETELPEGGSPEGLLVRLYFQRRGQANYAFTFGPTDVNGCITVTADEVEALREEGQRFAIMDYRLTVDRIDAARIDLLSAEVIQQWLRDEEERRARGVIPADDSVRQNYLNARNALFHPVSQTVQFGDIQAEALDVVLRARRKDGSP